MRHLGALLVLLLAAPALAADATGSVSHLTQRRAYLDRGAHDGLAAGQTLELTSRGRRKATCRIESVAAHHATCIGERLAPGDVFRLAPVPAKKAPAPARLTLAAGQLAARRTALLKAEYQPIPYERSADVGPAVARVEVAIGQLLWDTTDETAFAAERLDLAVNGVEVWNGLRLHARMTALGWAARPESARFAPGRTGQVFVRELELASREPDRSYTLALGRIWPWHVPGVAAFDGAQAGWRGTSAEIGAFGGFLPDPRFLSPTTERWLAGAYFANDRAPTRDSLLRIAHQEGRIGIVSPGTGAARVEGQWRAYASLGGRFDAAAELAGGYAQGALELDAARLDATVRPSESVRVNGGFRYFSGDRATVEPTMFTYSGAARDTSLSVAWDVSPRLSVSAVGGRHEELSTALARQYAGPELALPRLFGERGGMSFGYGEEFGWWRGRNAFAQAMLQPHERVDLLARLSYFGETLADTRSTHDLGVFLSAGMRLLPRLQLRLQGLVRSDLATLAQEEADWAAPVGYSVAASLRYRY